jgi:hypothetical protein
VNPGVGVGGGRDEDRRPCALWPCLFAALVVALPTLGMGFALDDHIQLLILKGRWPLGSPFDLFRFGGGSVEGMRRVVQEGPYPWWTERAGCTGSPRRRWGRGWTSRP